MNNTKTRDILNRIVDVLFIVTTIFVVLMTIFFLPSQNDVKKSQRRYANVGEEIGATQLTDFNTWTRNNLGGVNVYSPYCIRIYSDGGSTWSYLWTSITFRANTIVNYNFHVTAENSNLRTGIRIYNPSSNTDYVNVTETLSSPKTYQGSLIITTAETIRFDLRRNYYGTGYSGGCVWSISLAYSDYYSGIDAVLSNPDDYDLYTEIQYDANFDNGVDSVLNAPNDYDLYTEQQYEDYFNEGRNLGYSDGYDIGQQDGYADGYDAGRDEGYDVGYTNGTRDGYETGYVDGEDAGYNIGYEKGIESSTGFFAVIESATQSIHNFMSIEIIPGLTLATMLGVFVGLPLFFFFLKMISAK